MLALCTDLFHLWGLLGLRCVNDSIHKICPTKVISLSHSVINAYTMNWSFTETLSVAYHLSPFKSIPWTVLPWFYNKDQILPLHSRIALPQIVKQPYWNEPDVALIGQTVLSCLYLNPCNQLVMERQCCLSLKQETRSDVLLGVRETAGFIRTYTRD